MKYVLMGLAGLLLGAAAAAAVVFFNPLTGNRAASAEAATDWRLEYSFPGDGVLTHTHGGALPLPRRPAGVAELWEDTIDTTALTTMRLDGDRGAGPAWATRVSVLSTRTNLMFNGFVVSDHWLVSAPGAGSLFLTADTNLWPAVKETYLRVDVLGGQWRGPATYWPTLRSAGSPAVHGATGRFSGQQGRGIETFEVAAYDASRGLASLRGRLLVDFDGDGPFADAPAAQ